MKRRRRARAEATHYAGRVGDAEYGVTTLRSDPAAMGDHCRRPCPQCPWRADLPTGVFPPEAYRHSASTAYDMAPNTFACHMAGPDSPKDCAGFLMRGADHNLAVRLKIIRKALDPRQISDGGFPLYDSYRAMAEANGVDPDDPALARCRDRHS